MIFRITVVWPHLFMAIFEWSNNWFPFIHLYIQNVNDYASKQVLFIVDCYQTKNHWNANYVFAWIINFVVEHLNILQLNFRRYWTISWFYNKMISNRGIYISFMKYCLDIKILKLICALLLHSRWFEDEACFANNITKQELIFNSLSLPSSMVVCYALSHDVSAYVSSAYAPFSSIETYVNWI